MVKCSRFNNVKVIMENNRKEVYWELEMVLKGLLLVLFLF